MDSTDPIVFSLIHTVALKRGQMDIQLASVPLSEALGLTVEDLSEHVLQSSADFGQKRRGVETRIISGASVPSPDPTLPRLLAKAHRWCHEPRQGMTITAIAQREGHSDSYIRTRAPLAFLSPRIQSHILAGTQPVDLSVERLVRQGIPHDWSEQEARFGFVRGQKALSPLLQAEPCSFLPTAFSLSPDTKVPTTRAPHLGAMFFP